MNSAMRCTACSARWRYRGLADVEGDFVELPSQVMENWATEPEMLEQYALHYRTNDKIPESLVRKIRRSAQFNQGFEMTELLAAALSDMDIHSQREYAPFDVNAFEREALYAKRGLIPQIEPRYRYPYFSHIFDGGYSAGYYFYIWAQVLDQGCLRGVPSERRHLQPQDRPRFSREAAQPRRRGRRHDALPRFPRSGSRQGAVVEGLRILGGAGVRNRLAGGRPSAAERQLMPPANCSNCAISKKTSNKYVTMKKILSFMSLTLLVAGCADRTMPVADLPEIDTSNPLLAEWETPYATPPFERIELKDYEPAFDAAIAVQRAEIEAIVKNPAKPSFHNTIVALERSGELLSRIEGLFYNLLEAIPTTRCSASRSTCSPS